MDRFHTRGTCRPGALGFCLGVCAALALLSGCAVSTGQGPPRPGQPSFFNAGKALVLGVDVRTSQIAGPREFLPVPLVLINRRNADLTITRESFTLVRPDGVSLPVASTEEFWTDYPQTRADLRTSSPFFEQVFGRYPPEPFHWEELDFFPDRHSGVTPRDRWTLRAADGVFGIIYFRHPAADQPAPAGVYQLLMRPESADDAYVLDFVPYKTETTR